MVGDAYTEKRHEWTVEQWQEFHGKLQDGDQYTSLDTVYALQAIAARLLDVDARLKALEARHTEEILDGGGKETG